MEIPFTGMKFLLGDGENRSTAVILFHAYTGSPLDVALLAKRLNQAGYTILCPLFKGHGTVNIDYLLEATPQEWWKEAQAVIEWAQASYHQVLVFGLSMGGIMATKALTQPQLVVKAGGIFNSPIVTSQSLNLEGHFMRYAKQLFETYYSMAEYQARQADILMQHRQQVKQIKNFTQSFETDLTQIYQPFYVAQSGQDELIDADGIYDALDLLTNAKVDFHWLKENTHVITINRNRDAFETSLLHFINQQTISFY